MDKNKIKQQLKLAKEEFMKKNFSDSIKLCKTILSVDPNNISSLILYGASLLEIPSKKDESIQQFQKVIDLSPYNLFAWQGIEQYYEKCDKLTVCQQLFYTYANLLCLEIDEIKCRARAKKCIELWKNFKTKLDLGPFVATVLPKLKNEEITPQYLALCRILVEFPFTEDTSPLDDYLEKIYLALCNDDNFDQRFEIYCKLIPVLKSKGKRQQLVDTCEKMLSLYIDNAVAINFFCESFISNYIKTITDPEDDVLILIEKMSLVILERCEILLIAQPTNPNSLIAKSIALRRQNEFEESRKLLRKVLQVTNRSWQSWFLLTEIQINIHCYDDVIQCVNQAKKIMKPTFSCYQTMLMWEIEAYCCSSQCCTIAGRQLAIDMFNEHLYNKLIEYIIIASCNLNDQKTAKNYLNTLQNKCDKNDRYKYLEAFYFNQFGQFDDALYSLKSINNLSADVDSLLLLGNIMWNQQKVSEAGKLYLEASRISPHRCDLITKLGHYYREIKHLPIAITCYEKSILLNPDNEENGLALSDLYIILSKSNEQEALLNYLMTTKNIKWASLRLGLHYLKLKKFENAVNSFQIAVKYDPKNTNCYECLGDALLERGSLIGAKLTYSKCIELNPNLLYPKLQTAKIEYRIGQVDSSIQLFYNIANSYSNNFQALLETGKAFIEHAKSIFDCQVLTSYNLCKDASIYLYNALLIDNRNTFIWKLFGDLCIFIAMMPEKLSFISLPSNIFNRNQEDYIIKGLQLYTFSRRCYSQALHLTSKKISLNSAQKYIWYDITKCYLKNALSSDIDNNEKLEYKSKAEQGIKKCLLLDPINIHFWNTMGIIEAIDETKKQHLSYYCFVNSLKIEMSAFAYNNLGVKCMIQNDVNLAQEAFTLCQSIDPTLINSWLGQGLITRFEDSVESVFYHSTTLGYHEESICNYTEANYKHIDFHTEMLTPNHKIQHNIDLLIWLTSKDHKNSWAQNALSILYTYSGLYKSAIETAEIAEKYCTPETQIGMQRNLAFSLLKAKQYSEAISKYQQMTTMNVYDKFGIALALYKTGQIQEAYDTYTSLTENKSDINIVSIAFLAMAAIAFSNYEDYDKATTLFLKSIQSNTANVQALLATFALGIVTRKSNLSRTILHELISHRNDSVYMVDIVRFETYFYYLNRQPALSLKLISRFVHSHPNNAHLWLNFGFILLNYYMANESKRQKGLVSHIFTCATVISNKNWELKNALVLTTICNLFEGDLKTCLRNVMKGIHLYPTSSELWTVLLNTIYCRGNSDDAKFLKSHIEFVVNNLNPNEFLKGNLLQLETHIP
ncbi:Tetratricopeptide repeat,Tetratricopeptide repeat-containing domain,Tetratricopeptide-like helical [Cinara cedri]|uniref:Tetratricopeptide repeat,Tetratricopeptide repeat-containing domain,Tetratricopeptide-like helical n=1 Tax=Cinara cedri TaxID=506608 RepID=A0A5E4N3N0_9HEMI|nr:Tetratricopeptide repeat,Tetratricopeptide repeat-containing domain,Tetratricopeptide-like helical [Cinara cedri]